MTIGKEVVKMKKFFKLFFLCLLFTVLCILIYFIAPLKYSIEINELQYINTPYIIVEHQYTTAGVWHILGDETGFFETPIDASLIGNYPRISYNLQSGNNKYICFGEYKGHTLVANYYDNVLYEVKNWDILYPVDHQFIFPLPKSYLCRFDF